MKKKLENKDTDKDYYSTQELVAEPWFPIRSTLTVKKLIESGKLEAINISTGSRFKRYRISKKSVLEFMESEKGIVTKEKKIVKKKKK